MAYDGTKPAIGNTPVNDLPAIRENFAALMVHTAKGDIAIATALHVLAVLTLGTNGQHLVVDDTQPTGVKWETPVAATEEIVGVVKEFHGSVLPALHRWCDGTVYLRASMPRTFAAIGTVFNTGGELVTEFRISDRRARVGVGTNNVVIGSGETARSIRALGSSGGVETHILTIPEIPSHTHGVAASSYPNGAGLNAAMGNDFQSMPTGGGTAHINEQPYLACNFMMYCGE